MSLAMALILWVLLVVKAISYQKGRDPTVLLCVLAFALSSTCDVSLTTATYGRNWDDGNLLNLASSLFFDAGIYLLARSIIKAVGPARMSILDLTARLLLVATLIVQTISFFMIDSDEWVASIIVAYGDQPAAVVYNLSQIVFTSIVLAATGVVCLAYQRRMKKRRFRIGFLLTGIGCMIALVAETIATAYIAARYAGDAELQATLGAIHVPAFVLAVLTLAAGLALPGLLNTIDRSKQARKARRLAHELEPVWAHVTEARKHMRIPPGAEWDKLHRMIVETRDALLHSPALYQDMSEGALQTLEASERFLTRSSA